MPERLTLRSFISSCCFNFSKKDWKKSVLSTWRGATHKASISAPGRHSNCNLCCPVGSMVGGFNNNLVSALSKHSAFKATQSSWDETEWINTAAEVKCFLHPIDRDSVLDGPSQ